MATDKNLFKNFSSDQYIPMNFLNENKKMPLLTFDPLTTIYSLIEALIKTWEWEKKKNFFKDFNKFWLRSNKILRDYHKDWKKMVTILAYCGGKLKKGITCGTDPLVIGNNEICDCGYLIYNNCGFCSKKCDDVKARQEKYRKKNS